MSMMFCPPTFPTVVSYNVLMNQRNFSTHQSKEMDNIALETKFLLTKIVTQVKMFLIFKYLYRGLIPELSEGVIFFGIFCY